MLYQVNISGITPFLRHQGGNKGGGEYPVWFGRVMLSGKLVVLTRREDDMRGHIGSPIFHTD